jgi:hypothetical protein
MSHINTLLLSGPVIYLHAISPMYFLHAEACSQMYYRTPDICAMQQDNSDDLQAVGSILHNVAGVTYTILPLL